jgi:hypothetical protein
VKLTISGDLTWEKSFGGSLDDKATAIEQVADGGYIVAGFSSSLDGDVTGNHGDKDFWVLKLDATGTLIWEKALGGSAGDGAYSIHQAADGGYIVGGFSTSIDGDVTVNKGLEDYWVVKLDPSGILQWQKSFGGSESDICQSVTQTPAGGYILAGTSFSNDGDILGNQGGSDLWIVNIDAIGALNWQKCLGGTLDDGANSIEVTNDGGYIIAGYAASDDGDVSLNQGGADYWLVKLDPTQNIDWEKSLGGEKGDFASAVRQNDNGGFIMAGRTESSDGDVSGYHAQFDYWIVRLDTGLITFTYYLDLDGDGYGTLSDSLTSNFCQPPAGYVSDSTDCNDTSAAIHPFVAAIQWQHAMGGTNEEYAYDIQQVVDGGYIVVGNSKSNDDDVSGNHGGADYWIIKLDPFGILDWQKSLGGTGSEIAYAVYQTSDNGFVVAGASNSFDGDVTGNHGVYDYWIVKLDQNGSVIWKKCYGGPASDYATSIQQTTDGGYIVAGYSSSETGDVTGNHGGSDYW